MATVQPVHLSSEDVYKRQTPDSLAFDMVFSLREVKSGFTTYPKPILEPSAGDGALARQVHALAFNVHHDYKTGEVDQYDKGKARSAELDCIELSSDFRAKLKKEDVYKRQLLRKA